MGSGGVYSDFGVRVSVGVFVTSLRLGLIAP